MKYYPMIPTSVLCFLILIVFLVLYMVDNFFYVEFAKIYDRLGVTLIERGESFYQGLMGLVVEGLEKQGTITRQVQ